MIKWPNSFQIGISTNDPGLNVTEVLYYDKKNKKLRTQVYYSILGLEPTKALDLVLDEANEVVVIQTDKDCRKTKMMDSLKIVDLFFSMFDMLTDFEGLDQDGLKQFKLKQFEDIEDSPKFYFLFDDNDTFVRTRIK